MLECLQVAALSYVERGAVGDKEKALAAAKQAVAVARRVSSSSAAAAASSASSEPPIAPHPSVVGHVVTAEALSAAAKVCFALERANDALQYALDAYEGLRSGAGLPDDDVRVTKAKEEVDNYRRKVRRMTRVTGAMR